MTSQVVPPSRLRFTATLGTYTMSGFFGSTAIFSKYQPRPHNAWSALTRRQVAPASSERNTPPCPGGGVAGRPGAGGGGAGAVGSGTRQSTTAYTRRGLDGATAMPVRPIPVAGRPAVSWCQGDPPSVDLWMPPPGPLVGGDGEHRGGGGFPKPPAETRRTGGGVGAFAPPPL